MSAHNGYIESELTGGYFACCSCDWKSPERPTMAEAERDLTDHYKKTPNEECSYGPADKY